MNKKDFLTLMVCNFGTLVLLIEHLCGLEIALECMCVWTIVSMIIHIYILRDYVRLSVVIEEEQEPKTSRF
jgi:hypothetical protein